MDCIKLSLVDGDYKVQAGADLEINGGEDKKLADFMRQMGEELVTGATATLEVEGVDGPPLRFTVTQAV